MTKKRRPRNKVTGRARPKDPNRYPKGWDREKVQRVLEHYENQSDDEAVAEDEAAWRNGAFAMIQVPIELVPKVRKLLARRAG